MECPQGLYALLQFSPRPERFEFVNVGVVLWIPAREFLEFKFSSGYKRVERLFGRDLEHSGDYFEILKRAFESRLVLELKNKSPDRINEFSRTRANCFRMSQLQPIKLSENPGIDLRRLFNDLVGEEKPAKPRGPKARTKLKEKLEAASVTNLLEHNPRAVELPQGVKIEAQYGYQNGAYNLIEAVKLSMDPDNILREASKRAIEGQWLALHGRHLNDPKRLVVVGDFTNIDAVLYDAIDKMMLDHQAKLYRMDFLEPLVEDIKKNAARHRHELFN